MTRYVERLHAVVRGRVHAVGFRKFVQRHASKLGVWGWTRNLPGMTVEIVAEGDRSALDELIALLRVGPPPAEVRQLEFERGDSQAQEGCDDFRILADGSRADARLLRERFPVNLEER